MGSLLQQWSVALCGMSAMARSVLLILYFIPCFVVAIVSTGMSMRLDLAILRNRVSGSKVGAESIASTRFAAIAYIMGALIVAVITCLMAAIHLWAMWNCPQITKNDYSLLVLGWIVPVMAVAMTVQNLWRYVRRG